MGPSSVSAFSGWHPRQAGLKQSYQSEKSGGTKITSFNNEFWKIVRSKFYIVDALFLLGCHPCYQ